MVNLFDPVFRKKSLFFALGKPIDKGEKMCYISP